ncbi:MAG TPA: hypothetical protein VF940_12805 [Streptosporangiaceae bacterium]
MTTKAAPAAVPGPLGDPGAAAARRPRTILRQARDLAGVLPFTVYVLIGLVLPMGAILLGAFKTPVTGAFTWHNLHIASHGIYLHGFATSMELSLIASVFPGILGFLVAYAIYTAKVREDPRGRDSDACTRALPYHRPACRARLRPAQRGRRHGLLRVRPRAGSLRRA